MCWRWEVLKVLLIWDETFCKMKILICIWHLQLLSFLFLYLIRLFKLRVIVPKLKSFVRHKRKKDIVILNSIIMVVILNICLYSSVFLNKETCWSLACLSSNPHNSFSILVKPVFLRRCFGWGWEFSTVKLFKVWYLAHLELRSMKPQREKQSMTFELFACEVTETGSKTFFSICYR